MHASAECEFDASLLRHLQFAKTFGVPVYAGTGLQNGVLGVNTGSYARADPDGTFNPSPSKGW